MRLEIKNRDGNYGYERTIDLEERRCVECGQVKQCLVFDHSEDEYGTIDFCRTCLNNFFDHPMPQKNTWYQYLGVES